MTIDAIPDAALEADIAILGKKGRGKTYTAKGCVERLLDMGRRVVVLDPLSTWWGLKAGPNGYAIPVLGGPHGDLPLTDRDGAALGRHLATSTGSAVLDLGAMRKAELVRFATAFLEELYVANRTPLWLVLEEADVFAPQQPMADTARLLGEVDRIARRGRQFGFRLISLTQRPARLAKDVLTQLSTLVVLGITSPQDRAAVQAWVEGNADRDQAKSVVDSLASLKVGEGWVWAPDLELLRRITFPPIRTLDTSATPQAGAPLPKAALRTDVDLEALRGALTAAELEPAVAGSRVPASRARVVDEEAAERRGRERGYQEGFDEGRRQALEALGGISAALAKAADSLRAEPKLPTAPALPAPGSPPASAPDRPASEPRASGDLSPTAQRIIDVLEGLHPVSLTFKAAALRAGASPRSSQFRTYRREVIESGLVDIAGDRLTARRADAAKKVRNPLQAYYDKLQPSWAAMLAQLAGSTIPLTREDIADRAEVSRTSSGLGQGLRELLAMELIERMPDGRYRLNEALRPQPRAQRGEGA